MVDTGRGYPWVKDGNVWKVSTSRVRRLWPDKGLQPFRAQEMSVSGTYIRVSIEKNLNDETVVFFSTVFCIVQM